MKRQCRARCLRVDRCFLGCQVPGKLLSLWLRQKAHIWIFYSAQEEPKLISIPSSRGRKNERGLKFVLVIRRGVHFPALASPFILSFWSEKCRSVPHQEGLKERDIHFWEPIGFPFDLFFLACQAFANCLHFLDRPKSLSGPINPFPECESSSSPILVR